MVGWCDYWAVLGARQKAVISAAQPTYVLAWVTQLGPSLPLMYGGCRHLLTVYKGTL